MRTERQLHCVLAAEEQDAEELDDVGVMCGTWCRLVVAQPLQPELAKYHNVHHGISAGVRCHTLCRAVAVVRRKPRQQRRSRPS